MQIDASQIDWDAPTHVAAFMPSTIFIVCTTQPLLHGLIGIYCTLAKQ